MATQLPPKKGTPPIFGPCLVWPNGWVDQDATWYGGGRPRPRPHCVRWGPISPKSGTTPKFSVNVSCGQTVAHLSYCRALVFFLGSRAARTGGTILTIYTSYGVSAQGSAFRGRDETAPHLVGQIPQNFNFGGVNRRF